MTDSIAHLTQIGLALLGYLAIAWGAVLLITLTAALVIAYKDHRRSNKRIEALQRHHALHIERRPPA